jgi:hypothetical protein
MNLKGMGAAEAMLGGTLLINVENQWTQICQCMDELTLELTAEAKFSSNKAWKMTAQCLAAVFEEMYECGAKVARIADTTTIHGRSQVVWAVLQCHRIMEGVLSHKFRSHPSVVRVMSLFLLMERVDPKELIGLGDRIKKMENRASELDRAIKQVDVNKRDIGNIKADFEEFKHQARQTGNNNSGQGGGGGGRGTGNG